MAVTIEPARRHGATRLPDGRALAWAEWGPEDGTPVLFLSGAGMGASLGFGAGTADALGIRLAAVDRPGLGRSDHDPAKTLDTVAADLLRLVEARYGGAPVRVAAFSQGAPFALAFAARGGASAVALVSGQDDLGDPPVKARLPEQVAALVDAARADPAALEAQVAASATADWLHGMVMALAAPEDRAVYADPAFAAAYRACLEDGFARGAAGYARDLVAALGPWPFDPAAVRVPVRIWYGAGDTSPVHSPDLGERLASRLPRATRRVVPGAAGALPWTHGAEILADLLGA